MTQRKHVRIISEPMPKPLLTDTVKSGFGIGSDIIRTCFL